MTRPARIAVSALIAFAIAFLVAGVATGGGSEQPAAKSERAVRLAEVAALPALTEDPVVVARRRARARRAKVLRASRARRRAAARRAAAAKAATPVEAPVEPDSEPATPFEEVPAPVVSPPTPAPAPAPTPRPAPPPPPETFDDSG